MPDKPELLAPAGSMEALRAAVAAGADAVYLGTSSFGARADVGFSPEDTKRAIDFAHLYGVRVHVTVNTLCHERELPAVHDALAFLSSCGADAVLVQDAGVLRMILSDFPSLPVHASTQMTIYGPAGVRWLKDIGVRRAVLARECALPVIRECAAQGLETEVFIHGALCVSQSGQCGLSSWIGPRSGNRGRCAQPCRQAYVYRGREGCWLSPADLCGMESLPALMEAGVSSLKIEGRLKRPEYVYTVTSLYRRALDAVSAGKPLPFGPKEQFELTQIFSRGQFTKGYPAGMEDRGVMYPDYAAARGVLLGKTGASRRSNGAWLTDVHLVLPLSDGDGLRAGDQPVIYSGPDVPKGKAVLRLRAQVPAGTDVWRTESEEQLSRARSGYTEDALKQARPLTVAAYLTAKPGQPTSLVLTMDGVSARACDDPAPLAENRPLDEQSAFHSLSRMGGTPFSLGSLQLDAGPVFLSAGRLNALRKKGLDALEKAILEARRPKDAAAAPALIGQKGPACPVSPALFVLTSRPGEISALYEAGADLVFLELEDWREEAVASLFEDTPSPFILQLPAVCPDGVPALISRLNASGQKAVSLGSIGQLGAKIPNVLFAGAGVPVMNAGAERLLWEHGLTAVTLSRELSLSALRDLPKPLTRRLLPVYGKPRLMLLTHCPERTFRGLDHGKRDCRLCDLGEGTASRTLTDRMGAQYPLIPQRFPDGCRVGLYAPRPVSLDNWADEILRLSLSPLLQFTDETLPDRLAAVRRWRSLMDSAPKGVPLSGVPDRFMTGVL